MIHEIQFKAALPAIQSAVSVSGQEEVVRLKLDCYGIDLADIAKMRGKSFTVTVSVDGEDSA